MKVAHILNHFLPNQVAGTEVYTYALIRVLQQQVDCVVITPNYGERCNDVYEYENIQVYRYAEPSVVDRSLIMGKRKPDGIRYFEQLLQQIQPDVVHFHELAGSNGITVHHIASAKQLGIKAIITFHLATYSCKTGNLMYKGEQLCAGKMDIATCSKCYLHQKGWKNKWSLRVLLGTSSLFEKLGMDTTDWNNRIGTALGTYAIIRQLKERFEQITTLCDTVVSLTHWYRTILLSNGVPASKIFYIPQGLPDSGAIQQQATIPSTDTAKHHAQLKLIFVGRISAFKGLHLLLQAILTIPQEIISLDIFGQIQEADYAAHWQQQTAQNSNIRWCGTLAPQAVVVQMQQYDALCLCSTFSEMSPLVIQEALAAGIPIIASNVYGNAEQIKEGKNGWLFHFNDVDSLKKVLEQLIKYPDRVEAMKKNLTHPGNFHEIGQQYKLLYEQFK